MRLCVQRIAPGIFRFLAGRGRDGSNCHGKPEERGPLREEQGSRPVIGTGGPPAVSWYVVGESMTESDTLYIFPTINSDAQFVSEASKAKRRHDSWAYCTLLCAEKRTRRAVERANSWRHCRECGGLPSTKKALGHVEVTSVSLSRVLLVLEPGGNHALRVQSTLHWGALARLSSSSWSSRPPGAAATAQMPRGD